MATGSFVGHRVAWLGVFLIGAMHSVMAVELNLEQAVNKALSWDPRIEERQQLVNVARALLEEAEGADGFVLGVNAFLGLAPGVDGGLFEEECGDGKTCQVRDDRYTLADGLSPWVRAEYFAIKPLYTFGKVENYSRAAKANIGIKQADVRLQRAETIYSTTKAYYGFLTARDSRLFLEGIGKQINDALVTIETRLEDGDEDAKQTDVFAMQSAHGLVLRYIATAQGFERIALDGLKLLTGVGLDNELTVASKRLVSAPMPKQPLAILKVKAATSRPEVVQLESGLKARRALVAAKKSLKKPNIYAGFVGLFSYSVLRDRVDNPHITDPFNDIGSTPIVGVQWAWAMGRQPAQVLQAQAELDALIQKSSFAKQGIAFQVAEQYHQVVAHDSAMKSLFKSAKSARKWMISSYANFEAGLEEVDSVVTAFQTHVLSYTDYLQTVFDYNMHIAKLEQVTGAYD